MPVRRWPANVLFPYFKQIRIGLQGFRTLQEPHGGRGARTASDMPTP